MKRNVVKFSTDWISDGQNASADERATLCDLRIMLADQNMSEFHDLDAKEYNESVVVPAVHLAEGIATNWWKIFGARDVEHRALPWRKGFVLPDLRFEFDGSTFAVTCVPSATEHPTRLFWQEGQEFMTRQIAESVLSRFVERVVDKLHNEEIDDSQVELAWSRVRESSEDQAERDFCEAAGALGVDPYSITDADANFIEQTGRLFEDEALIEFLAGIGQMSAESSARAALVEWIESLQPRDRSCLPELADVAGQVRNGRAPGRSFPWVRGRRTARAFREAIGMDDGAAVSIKAVAEKLGGTRFARKGGPRGVFAVVAREGDDVHVHLRGRGRAKWASSAETFAFARAIGDAVCFPATPRSVINDLHRAERQAVGRAFAAEFVAPVRTVLNMWHDGRDVEEIAGSLGVSPMVVNHQIEDSRKYQFS
ncbi:MAG: hypothetical protein OXP28_05390 [Gammaproteobacteria bacterium]|nr:hypothetical protein [Gammaproteobacteria bacterium]